MGLVSTGLGILLKAKGPDNGGLFTPRYNIAGPWSICMVFPPGTGASTNSTGNRAKKQYHAVGVCLY